MKTLDSKGRELPVRVQAWWPPVTAASLQMSREEFNALRREVFEPSQRGRTGVRETILSMLGLAVSIWVILQASWSLASAGFVIVALLLFPVGAGLLFAHRYTLAFAPFLPLERALLARGRCPACAHPLTPTDEPRWSVCPECGGTWNRQREEAHASASAVPAPAPAEGGRP